jgi:hypothetical protein
MKKKIGFKLPILMMILGAGLLITPVFAQEKSVLLVHPIADAHVMSFFSNVNFGSSVGLKVQSGFPMNSRVYLKYVLPENLGKYKIENAVLAITPYDWSWSAGRTGLGEVTIYRTSSDWNEMTITWNNAPSVGEKVGILIKENENNLRTYEKIYAPLNLEWVPGGELSFVIKATNENLYDGFYVNFLSREAGGFGTIEMVVTRFYAVPPSMVSIALVLVLMFAGIGIYWKVKHIEGVDSLVDGLLFLLYIGLVVVVTVAVAKSFLY